LNSKPAVGAFVIALGGVAVAIARQLQHRTDGAAGTDEEESRSRWRGVTINRSPAEVMLDGQLPQPLAALGDLIEVEVAQAPGGRGTELRARLRQAVPSGAVSAAARLSGNDQRQQVRSALREAKQLIEVGEVLRVNPTPHGKRPATPAGKLVDIAARRAPGEGVL